MKVAVLGAGIMGRGVALVLARAGFEVRLWNRTPTKSYAVAKEYTQEISQKLSQNSTEDTTSKSGTLTAFDKFTEVVQGVDAIMVVLYDEASVMWALGEAAQLIASDELCQDIVWVQCATIGVQAAERVNTFCQLHNIHLVEANMMGSKTQAETGELVYITGGKDELLDKIRPILDAGSKKIVRCGENVGDGSAVKIACNSWIAFLTTGAAQSVAMLKDRGVDPNLWLNVIMNATSASPYAALKAPKMIEEDFSTQFAVDAILKDLGFARELCDMSNVNNELVGAISRKFEDVSTKGFGTDDISAVIKAL